MVASDVIKHCCTKSVSGNYIGASTFKMYNIIIIIIITILSLDVPTLFEMYYFYLSTKYDQIVLANNKQIFFSDNQLHIDKWQMHNIKMKSVIFLHII